MEINSLTKKFVNAMLTEPCIFFSLISSYADFSERNSRTLLKIITCSETKFGQIGIGDHFISVRLSVVHFKGPAHGRLDRVTEYECKVLVFDHQWFNFYLLPQIPDLYHEWSGVVCD